MNIPIIIFILKIIQVEDLSSKRLFLSHSEHYLSAYVSLTIVILFQIFFRDNCCWKWLLVTPLLRYCLDIHIADTLWLKLVKDATSLQIFWRSLAFKIFQSSLLWCTRKAIFQVRGFQISSSSKVPGLCFWIACSSEIESYLLCLESKQHQ